MVGCHASEFERLQPTSQDCLLRTLFLLFECLRGLASRVDLVTRSVQNTGLKEPHNASSRDGSEIGMFTTASRCSVLDVWTKCIADEKVGRACFLPHSHHYIKPEAISRHSMAVPVTLKCLQSSSNQSPIRVAYCQQTSAAASKEVEGHTEMMGTFPERLHKNILTSGGCSKGLCPK